VTHAMCWCNTSSGVVHRFRWKSWAKLREVEQAGSLGDRRVDTQLGAIGVCSAGLAADRAEVVATPGREFLFEMIVGDGGAEVPAQGGRGFRLGMAVGTDDLQIAAQDRVVAASLPDGMEVVKMAFCCRRRCLAGTSSGRCMA